MPISSNIISVDTLQIRPVEEAVQQGQMMMSDVPYEMSGPLPLPWDSYPINTALVILAVLVFILQLRRLLRISPFLFEGMFRSKKLLDLEDGVRLIRDRNTLALNSVLIMVLVSSRYGLYAPSFMEDYPGGIRTLLTLGIFILFLLFRHLMIIGMSRYKLEGELYQLNNRIANDYLILLTIFVMAVAGVLSVFHVSPDVVRTVLYYVIAAVYTLFILMRSQILSSSCAQLPAILYLCILEILPAGLLVASEILF